MSKKTRSAIECPIFGEPKDLVCLVLPTFWDIMNYFLWVRHNLEQERVNRNLLVSETSEIVAQKIEEIWKSASVPTVSHQRIPALIKEYQKKRKDLLKPHQQRKDVPSYKSKIEAFIKDNQRLFDFAACKCAEFESCSYLKPNKVLLRERPFLKDQRAETEYTDSESEPGKSDYNKDDPAPKMTLFSKEPSTSGLRNRNLSNLSVLENTLDRYEVSDRAGATIASAVFQDYGIVTSKASQNIIDGHKVRRARQKKRQKLKKSSKISMLRGLYFDGLNKLLLRHLLQHLDGETTGLRTFQGSVGKLLSNCENLPIMEFSKIECELSDIDTIFELSTDQKYLH
ncbi:unnamed protein product [Psylliodes chrysocephalus]|uniref:Uncharacterized protein n=1 Tax=Psylliodes chrysocephalus TaxID=3402493 RepID=A0A9P0CFP1_9CUCU|nr:unnamed protein product [Psylliodes chrysocephala]